MRGRKISKVTDERLARVRYIKGKPESEKSGKWDDDEQFAIEIYDNSSDTWNQDSCFILTHSSEYPDSGANFLHYGVIKCILKLLNSGYRFIDS